MVVEVVDQTIDDVPSGTIVRTIGSLTLRALTAAQSVFFRAGLIIVTDDALQAGAVPDPWVDPASWMWEHADMLRVSNSDSGSQYMRLAIDVKVQRRLPQIENSLAMVFDNSSFSGASFEFFLNLKVLVRVP